MGGETAPNNRVSNYMRQKLIEFQIKINDYIIIFGDINNPVSEMDKCSGQKSVRT